MSHTPPNSQINDQTAPQVIYIAGAGRSGSTLLDILLGNHPDMVGVGELSAFFQEWARGGQCTCGQSYPECQFWGQVILRLQSTFPNLIPEEAEAVTRRMEALFGPWRAPVVNRAADRQFYGKLWRTLLTAISQESGKRIIVDSSKNSHPVVRRVPALVRIGQIEVSVIHLVRDPRALIWSGMRGSNRLLAEGQRVKTKGVILKVLLSWGLAHTSVHITKAANSSLSFIRMRYEDLVSNPVEALTNLGDAFNLEVAPVVELINSQGPFDGGHGVSGNRLRRQEFKQIKADEEWKRALPKHAHIWASLLWPLARQYGYDVLHRAK